MCGPSTHCRHIWNYVQDASSLKSSFERVCVGIYADEKRILAHSRRSILKIAAYIAMCVWCLGRVSGNRSQKRQRAERTCITLSNEGNYRTNQWEYSPFCWINKSFYYYFANVKTQESIDFSRTHMERMAWHRLCRRCCWGIVSNAIKFIDRTSIRHYTLYPSWYACRTSLTATPYCTLYGTTWLFGIHVETASEATTTTNALCLSLQRSAVTSSYIVFLVRCPSVLRSQHCAIIICEKIQSKWAAATRTPKTLTQFHTFHRRFRHGKF